MPENYNDNYQPQGGPLAQVAEAAGDMLERALAPLSKMVKELNVKITHHVGRIDRFEERLSVLESLVKGHSAEMDNIQGRVSTVSAADLKNQRMFPCPVCGAPNEFHPMPGEADQAAKDRVCCHRCGIHTGNKVLVERALADRKG